MRFYLSMECEGCDETVHTGPVMTLIERNGLPVIPYDIAAQESFYCDECGTDHHTGDFDVRVEPGDEDEEEDE